MDVRKFSKLLAICALTPAAAALAQDAKEPATVNVGIGVLATHFKYTEYDSADRVLDTEKGFLPGAYFNLEGDADNYYWRTRLSYQKATARYRGSTSLGTPLETDTKETVSEAAFEAGRRFTSRSSFDYALGAGIGYRRWNRDIGATPSVGGLLEIYQWWYGFVGAEATLAKDSRFDVRLNLRIMQPVRPQVAIDFKGAYAASPKLVMAERPGFFVSLPWRIKQIGGGMLTAEPYYEEWNFGRSESASFRSGPFTLSVTEPKNRTQTTGLRLSWSKPF